MYSSFFFFFFFFFKAFKNYERERKAMVSALLLQKRQILSVQIKYYTGNGLSLFIRENRLRLLHNWIEQRFLTAGSRPGTRSWFHKRFCALTPIFCALRLNFEKLFTGAKVWRKAQKISAGCKTVYEIGSGTRRSINRDQNSIQLKYYE